MTGFLLPTAAAAPIAQWTLQDWGAPTRASAPAKADGVARVEFDQLDTDVQWLIDRAVVSCTSGSLTSCRLYDTDTSPTNLLSGTASGNFDEAEYPAGLLVREMRRLVVVWTGCDVGAVGSVRLQTRVMRRT